MEHDTLSPGDIVTIQSGIALIAVEALIAIHPDPAAVRRVFDQVFSQMQAGTYLMGSPAASDLCRQMIQKIFPSSL